MAQEGYYDCQDDENERRLIADGFIWKEEADCWEEENTRVYFWKVLLHKSELLYQIVRKIMPAQKLIEVSTFFDKF